MNYKNIILFFVLFALKETLSFDSIQSSYQYDITKLLDQWFAKIFQVDVKLASEVKESFGYAEHYRLEDVEYKLTHAVKPFENKFIFQNVYFYMEREDNIRTSNAFNMNCNFQENKISVSVKNLTITVKANLRHEHDTPYLKLFTTLHFENFKLSATRPQKNNENISFDISYDHFYTYNYGCCLEIQWDTENTSTSIKMQHLNEEVKPALVAMLRENIKRNEQSSRAFNTLFSTILKTKADLISAHPDIHEEQKYYYLIPKVLFYRFSLKSIRIEGLQNIEALSVDNLADIFTHTLLVKSIRGNMFLDYGSVEGAPKPLELDFEADHLMLSIRQERNCAHVEARYFSVNSTTTGPLTHRQATVIMERIESAIVSSIMPSKQAWRLCDIETPIEKLKTSDTSDWKTIKETYKTWIPFNEE